MACGRLSATEKRVGEREIKKRTRLWQARKLRAAHRRKLRAISVRERRLGKSTNYFFNPRLYHQVTAPEKLSFSENGEETIAFFADVKKAIFSEQRIRIDGKFRRKQLLLHLDEVKHISLPCAVVLSAELKRWTIHVELIPKLVAFEKWDKRVRSLLISLGTLKHLGIQKKQYNAFSSKPFPGQVFLLELTSAKVQSGEKVSSIQEGTAKLADFFSPKPFIFRALLEATNNSIEHAYSLVEKQRFPNADGGRWYATASFDPNKDALRFFVYDQGIGIPATLETKSLWRSLVDDLRTKLGGEGDAGTIAAAIEVGRTRTELSERGKGLNDIVAVLERVGDGYVRIISARGDYTRHADGTVEQSNYSSHIGGTLIEWSLPVDAIRSEKPKYG